MKSVVLAEPGRGMGLLLFVSVVGGLTVLAVELCVALTTLIGCCLPASLAVPVLRAGGSGEHEQGDETGRDVTWGHDFAPNRLRSYVPSEEPLGLELFIAMKVPS